jgi:protein-tyrosine-phosphatase
MFKFAIKNMAIKKVKIVLIVISIVISACVALLAYNISEQVDDGFKSTAAYYDIIIGMDRYNMRNMQRITSGDPDGKMRMLLSHDVADPWYTGNFDETYDDVSAGCRMLLEELAEA